MTHLPPAAQAPAASRAATPGKRVADVLAWAVCALLAGMSVYGFQLRCEGFGCMGRGLWWMLWAALAVTAGCIGLGLRLWQSHRGLPRRPSGFALALLWAMAAGHFLYWLTATCWH